ncbi:glycosyltransferase family 2 protein [Sphingobium lignivorans]|uniref:GT2 family glycosyltransferase n=1 Tax=Sphingobium lignivorans TaxID=2735886 RepID=A0ABR6NJL6_9SPHN|nr:glycosyltransferase family A protein [Sphingobium lignivorans]MBB5987481.1 GT2 family glycosyltransferase [Sphingobium lignivorans]
MSRIGLVAIGRNEGERLKRCLRAVPAGCPVVYVDSGSTDGSVDFARGLGMAVELLPTEGGFTAARARNAGWRRLVETHPALDYVQFVDGDCELAPGWLARAESTLDAEPGLCAVFGRRRERFPGASIYNALCDDEWNVPIGLVNACGGDVLFRVTALRDANGYSDDLIAGEEPDLCLRLRQKGWTIRRIDAEMTLHDADIHKARQWWLRARRSGHAFAEHVARHGDKADPLWSRQRESIVIWGGTVPALVILLALVGLLFPSRAAGLGAILLALLYPLQVARIAFARWRGGASPRFALAYAFWIMAGKMAQFGGLVRFHRKRRSGRASSLIEYKGAS